MAWLSPSTGTTEATPAERSTAERWVADAILADGGTCHVRPIRPDDGPALVAFHERLSPESIYLRFFSAHPHLSDREIEYFTHVDHSNRAAFVAELDEGVVGVGRYDRIGGTDAAEVAFVVGDRHQGRGIGTLLLEYLAARARENGIARFTADTLPHNRSMLAVFRAAGFAETARLERDAVRVTLELGDGTTARSAIEAREWTASVHSIERVLRPRSVAVIGAGRADGGIGKTIVRNLLDSGFRGPVFPVNPHASSIAGAEAFPTLQAIPGDVDLVVVAVPAASVVSAVDACAAKRVRALVIVSSGFAEVGAAGAALEREVIARAHRGGMRIVGPNCIGIINTAADVSLNATFAPTRPIPGRVAFASQSGALGIAMLERAAGLGLGLSSFVSMGNKADVSGNDLLRYWEADAATSVILLYLESFGNPRMFSRVARRVSRTKAIVAVKGGRSVAGARAAASHTAALATSDTAVDALFTQTGVIRVDSLGELFDVAAALAGQPLPRGSRVGVVGNAGGAGILAADAAETAGLMLPALGESTRARISAACPSAASVANPVDLGAGATPQGVGEAAAAVLADSEVDSLLVVHAPVRHAPFDEVADVLASTTAGATKPVLVALLAADHAPDALHAAGLPFHSFPETAARVLGRITRYAAWRQQPQGRIPDLAGIDAGRARLLVDAALEASPGGGWLDQATAVATLSAYGVSTAAAETATSAEAAAAAAVRIGLPVALKVEAPSLVHKSDIGGVVTGLATQAAVRRAWTAMHRRLGAAMRAATVQGMVGDGVQLIVGVLHDPLFGPLLMFGSGGTTAELYADRAFRVLPLTDLDVHELVTATKAQRLLAGWRGAPAADVAAVEDLLLRVARLADDLPELAEMDLNPVIARPDGVTVVDAKLRLAAVPPPDPLTRRLREAGRH